MNGDCQGKGSGELVGNGDIVPVLQEEFLETAGGSGCAALGRDLATEPDTGNGCSGKFHVMCICQNFHFYLF